MKRRLERTYGRTLKGLMFAVNPFKKKILKTYCTVHKFININALSILKNEGYTKEYEFFKEHIKSLNEGVTWADQDFKSSNHFYHYKEGTGLYGFSNALTEAKKYYAKSIAYMSNNDMEKSLFYFGAVCHLIQDSTVPQHVNNKLLRSHRQFEVWITSKLLADYEFHADEGIVRYKKLDEYIKNNATLANDTYLNFINLADKEEKYGIISSVILKEAQKTTAGAMLDYYDLYVKNNKEM